MNWIVDFPIPEPLLSDTGKDVAHALITRCLLWLKPGSNGRGFAAFQRLRCFALAPNLVQKPPVLHAMARSPLAPLMVLLAACVLVAQLSSSFVPTPQVAQRQEMQQACGGSAYAGNGWISMCCAYIYAYMMYSN